METGIKALDKCIHQFGLKAEEGTDVLQRVTLLPGGASITLPLPYCFRQVLTTVPAATRVQLHEIFMPWRKERLASYLIDEKGQVLEQVYYQRDLRHTTACKRIQRWLTELYRQQWQNAA